MLTKLFVLGAGGHGRVVVDAIMFAMPHVTVEVWDDDPRRNGEQLYDWIVRAPLESSLLPQHGHIALGDNQARENACARLSALGCKLLTIVHPAAVVSARADLGAGIFVAARAVVAPSAEIRRGVIVNHGSVVDHDCKIGEFAHIAPNAVVGGSATVGRSSLIGAGAVVLPGICVGDGVVVGAGAVVTRDVEDGKVVCGIPAKAHRT